MNESTQAPPSTPEQMATEQAAWDQHLRAARGEGWKPEWLIPDKN